ncbi:Metallo-dependent phosphatase [Aulographum hederae CBS 113979]|uniref:Metallo-dependent phosphatase n=1 Tax=Aulographum hederae CBS 113979 TaxID=1176131 RepID=A0A6G1H0C6_9PEZI|nr:Metallo-dependent phosphatase [Aulographum hederae CBS 113979]
MAQALIETSILIISDTHGYDAEDIVLHCGDITEDGQLEDYKKAIELLGSIDAKLKLVIAGNHDVSLDWEFYLAQGGSPEDHQRAIDLWQSPQTKSQGIIFLQEGTHTFTLPGTNAKFVVYASLYTPKYGVSAFQYDSLQDIYNPADPITAPEVVAAARHVIPENVDIVITHGPPKCILDSSADGNSSGCPHLRRAIARSKPRIHCFGHMHLGWEGQMVQWNRKGATDDGYFMMPKPCLGKNQIMKKGAALQNLTGVKKGNATFFLNAAIMDGNGEPTNAPWLLEIDLPVDA